MSNIYKRQFLKAQELGIVAMLATGAANHGLKPALVLAVASRETNLKNVIGDNGHGRGLMQLDDRSHPEVNHHSVEKEPEWFVDECCAFLSSNIAWAKQEWPEMDERQHLKIALSAYNCGRGGARYGVRLGDSDKRTTGGDYAHDVLHRVTLFEELLEETQ